MGVKRYILLVVGERPGRHTQSTAASPAKTRLQW
jgi:hypothetical protein